jgi:hypothetical protein
MAGVRLTNPVHLRWRAMRAQRLDPAAALQQSFAIYWRMYFRIFVSSWRGL